MHFTFVIPAYNEEDYIVDTVQSLYPQSLTESTYSIIIVNNSSTDTTEEKLLSFIEETKADNVFILNEYVKGIIPARRAGVEKAIELQGVKDHWIVNGDADTKYTHDWVANLLITIAPNPQTEFIQCIAEGGDLSEYPNILALTQPPKDKAKELIGKNKYLPVDDKVCSYSANFYRKTGGYNREYYDDIEQMAETWRMYIKGKLLGFSRVFCDTNTSIHSKRREKEQFLELELGGLETNKLYEQDIRGGGKDMMSQVETNPKAYITKQDLRNIFLNKIRVLCFTGLLLEKDPILNGTLASLNNDMTAFLKSEAHSNLYLFEPGWVFRDAARLTAKLNDKLCDLADF
ncbi:glycosyltransferase family 2 protein [bacterium]|nr:glycosyltransferase family 2 protein [bacterium]